MTRGSLNDILNAHESPSHGTPTTVVTEQPRPVESATMNNAQAVRSTTMLRKIKSKTPLKCGFKSPTTSQTPLETQDLGTSMNNPTIESQTLTMVQDPVNEQTTNVEDSMGNVEKSSSATVTELAKSPKRMSTPLLPLKREGRLPRPTTLRAKKMRIPPRRREQDTIRIRRGVNKNIIKMTLPYRLSMKRRDTRYFHLFR